MARNLARSSSGMSSSMASWRTRSLSCSQEISRSRNRSAGSSSGGRMNRPFAARGWKPRGEVIALASDGAALRPPVVGALALVQLEGALRQLGAHDLMVPPKGELPSTPVWEPRTCGPPTAS